ncbi:MAG: lysophospholipid acyltransferase family protein [Sandaracinaceae bacterium]
MAQSAARWSEPEGAAASAVAGPVPTTLAAPLPPDGGRLDRMPRLLRVALTGIAFAFFFGGSLALGLVAAIIAPWMSSASTDRWAFTRALNRHLGHFAAYMRGTGLISYWHPRLPPGRRSGAYLLVANHPTLIDVILLLSSFPELTCVVKARWYANPLLGALLRRTVLIGGAGQPGDGEGPGETPVFRRIEAMLEAGVPVLVFPEGTRSAIDHLRRFRRGAIEAAVRTGVPILPLFIAPSEPILRKGRPFWDVPARTCRYRFEWFPAIETRGRGLDPRRLVQQLQQQYNDRFARLLAEREAPPGDTPR